ncbi:MAG: hypothetical protein K9G62_03460 [Alphaproteobacteria bacterium]|nr:hypothetical protein [Alphaproteobacteria bacterium]
MISIVDQVSHITHPLVSSLYLKKDPGKRRQGETVLVIETNFSEQEEDHESFDSHLLDLLLDLQDLKDQAESRVGKLDRIDIRSC